MKTLRIQILFMAMVLIMGACKSRNAEEAKTGEAKETGSAEGIELTLLQDQSSLKWRGTKPGGEHYGTVVISDGKLVTSDGKITGGTMKIDLEQIDCEDLDGNMESRLVGHLKSEDFFYTEVYPIATFEISSIQEKENPENKFMNFEVTGNLTLRGVTKSISFPASIVIKNGEVTAKSAEFAIDRTLWGVNFKSKSVFAEFKDDYISDLINLQFDVKFIK